MKYTVVWRPSAEHALAEIWTEAADRSAITMSANSIDVLLRTDPESVGESQDSGARLLYVAPLAVFYDVATEDRQVAVWAVWHHPERDG